MHQIVCRLGLRPRPHWGSLQHPPDPLAGLGVRPLGKGKEEREGEKREGSGGEGREGSPGMP